MQARLINWATVHRSHDRIELFVWTNDQLFWNNNDFVERVPKTLSQFPIGISRENGAKTT